MTEYRIIPIRFSTIRRKSSLHGNPLFDIGLLRTAPWRSGDAADCKSVYPGSIPGGASKSRLRRPSERARCVAEFRDESPGHGA